MRSKIKQAGPAEGFVLVSIRLLMDNALEDNPAPVLDHLRKGFNPTFNG